MFEIIMGNRIQKIAPSRSPMQVLAVGAKGSGKSSMLNCILDEELFPVNHHKRQDSDMLQISKLKVGNITRQPVLSPSDATSASFDVYELPSFDLAEEHETRDNIVVGQIHQILLEKVARKPLREGGVPSFLLIHARFDDYRIDGEYSNFVRVLKRIRRLPCHILEMTQVVLVLTRSSGKIDTDHVQLFLDLTARHLALKSENILACNVDNRSPWEEARARTKSPKIWFNKMPVRRSTTEVFLNINDCRKDPCRFDASARYQYTNLEAVTLKRHDPLNESHKLVVESKRIGAMESATNENTFIISKIQNSCSDANLECEDLIRMIRKYNVYTRENDPNWQNKVVGILKEMYQVDPFMVPIVEGVLEFDTPRITPTSIFAGCGYNIMTDEVCVPGLEVSYSKNNISAWGYKLPDYIKCTIQSQPLEPETIFYTFTTQTDLNRCYFSRFCGNVIPRALLSMNKTRLGYNNILRSPGVRTAVKEYRPYKLELSDTWELNDELKSAVNNLTVFKSVEKANYNYFHSFFRTYGTHLITNNHAGGFIRCTATSTDWYRHLQAAFGFRKSSFEEAFADVNAIDEEYDGGKITGYNVRTTVHGYIPFEPIYRFVPKSQKCPVMLNDSWTVKAWHDVLYKKLQYRVAAKLLKEAYEWFVYLELAFNELAVKR